MRKISAGFAKLLYSKLRSATARTGSPGRILALRIIALNPLFSQLSGDAQREVLGESINSSIHSEDIWYRYLKILHSDREIRRVEEGVSACAERFPLVSKFFGTQLLLFSKRDSSADWRMILDGIRSRRFARFSPIYREMREEARYQYVVSEAKAQHIEKALAAMIEKPDQPVATFLREAEYVVRAIKSRLRSCGRESTELLMLERAKDTLRAEIARRIEHQGEPNREFFRFRASGISLWLSPEDGEHDKAEAHLEHLREFAGLRALLPFREFLERMSEIFAERKIRPRLYMNIRASERERVRLTSYLLAKIKEQNPFSLVRLGDGESWAFEEYIPGNLKSIFEDDFSRRENGWWGSPIPPDAAAAVRNDVAETVLRADIIGIPELYRLARDVKPSGELTFNTRGLWLVQEFLRRNILSLSPEKLPVLTDERCNLEIFDRDFLFAAIGNCESAILIGGFPEDAIESIRWPKPIRYIRVPPHERTVLHDRNLIGRLPLPLVLEDISRRLDDMLVPGALVLVAAGIAGKRFIGQAKKRGAMAIDIGSSLDSLLGYN